MNYMLFQYFGVFHKLTKISRWPLTSWRKYFVRQMSNAQGPLDCNGTKNEKRALQIRWNSAEEADIQRRVTDRLVLDGDEFRIAPWQLACKSIAVEEEWEIESACVREKRKTRHLFASWTHVQLSTLASRLTNVELLTFTLSLSLSCT